VRTLLVFASLAFTLNGTSAFAEAGAATPVTSNKQPTRHTAQSPIHVRSLDSSIDMSQFAEKYQIDQSRAPTDRDVELPTPKARDEILNSAQLTKYVLKWDDLERDILYRRARRYDLAGLQNYYPDIPPQNLQQLKSIIEQRNR
jgi:hypothetical protein